MHAIRKLLTKFNFSLIVLLGIALLFNNCSDSGVLKGAGDVESAGLASQTPAPAPAPVPVPTPAPAVTPVTEFISNFALGTQNSTVGGATLALDPGNAGSTGEYTSPILDAKVAIKWDTLSWSPSKPYGKQFVANQLGDMGYDSGGLTMLGNLIYLRMNEIGTPTLFEDVSRAANTDNNATCVAASCPTPTTLGVFGGAMAFNGAATQHLIIPHKDEMLANSGTFSFWFRGANEATNLQGLVSKDATGGGTGGHFNVLYYPGGRVHYRLQSVAGGQANAIETPAGIAPNVWHHVVASFGAAGQKLFVDGVLMASSAYTGGLGTSSGGTGNFESIVLGANGDNRVNLTNAPINFPLTGAIDEFAFVNRQFSNDESIAAYRRGIDKIEIQIRSCDDATCSSNPAFVAGYSDFLNVGAGLPSVNLLGRVPNNRYFQYKVRMSSNIVANSPVLKQVKINGSVLP